MVVDPSVRGQGRREALAGAKASSELDRAHREKYTATRRASLIPLLSETKNKDDVGEGRGFRLIIRSFFTFFCVGKQRLVSWDSVAFLHCLVAFRFWSLIAISRVDRHFPHTLCGGACIIRS